LCVQAKKYLKSLHNYQGKDFQKIYPAADPLALDLLRHLLQFNPEKRYTAEQALNHDFFKSIRRPEMEVSTKIGQDGLTSYIEHALTFDCVFHSVLGRRC